MSLTMTESAAQQVQKYLDKRGKGIGIRLGVKTTGCSGMAYTLEYADDVGEGEIVHESQGLKILVDPKSMAYLEDTELDFVKQGLSEGFQFNNPNERGKCGCGESFRV